MCHECTSKDACAPTLKRPRTVDKENVSHGDNMPPPKRGRHSKNRDDGHKCGSCTVWLQTGSNDKLAKYHNMGVGRVRHPGDKAVQFSTYLSCNGTYNITLRNNSCMCDACYRDYQRGVSKPRWVGLSKYIVCKHCFVCCPSQSSCLCEEIREWGPSQHFECESELKLWLNYFQLANDHVTYIAGKEYGCANVIMLQCIIELVKYVNAVFLINGTLGKLCWNN